MPFLAHLGVGLIAKYINPKVNVGILLSSAMLLDLLTFFFSSALWVTHGMIMAAIWAIGGAGLYALGLKFWAIHKQSSSEIASSKIFRDSLTIGVVIFLHWVFDLIGWPMTIMPGMEDLHGTPFFFSDTPSFGFGVYRTWLGALFMEIGFFTVGLVLACQFFYGEYRKRKNFSQNGESI